MGVFVEALREFGVEITVDGGARAHGHGRSGRTSGPAGPAADRRRLARRARCASRPTSRRRRGLRGVRADERAIVVTDFADIIPGVAEMVAALRARGLKIGSTTGYTRDIMAEILPVAAARALCPTASSAPATRRGRPDAADDVPELPRSRRLARIRCHQGRRHRGRHRRRYRSWQLDRRRDAVGQCDRPVARRTGSADVLPSARPGAQRRRGSSNAPAPIS